MTASHPPKPLPQRIAYFVRKLRQYSDARYDVLMRRTDRKPPANRMGRLQTYKDALDRLIDAA